MRAAWRASLTDSVRPRRRPAADGRRPRRSSPDAWYGPDRTVLAIAQIAERAVANVATQRSTWTVWNLRAEAERIARAECSPWLADRAPGDDRRDRRRGGLPAPVDQRRRAQPAGRAAALRRGDGESVFTEHAAERYTSQAVLDAEQRLLAAASHAHDRRASRGPAVAAALDGYEALTGRRSTRGSVIWSPLSPPAAHCSPPGSGRPGQARRPRCGRWRTCSARVASA